MKQLFDLENKPKKYIYMNEETSSPAIFSTHNKSKLQTLLKYLADNLSWKDK